MRGVRFRKLGLYLGILLFTGHLNASDIRLGLYHGSAVRSLVFSVIQGEYILSGDGQQVVTIRKGTMFHIEITGRGLEAEDSLQSYGVFHKLDFRGVSSANIFQVKPVLPSLPAKESDDNLNLGIMENSILIINILNLEKYISGCVEAEGGSNAVPEFYKAQAVLSRTFAIKNFTRHSTEGFNLCDNVHCQAFAGKSRMNRLIYNAVLETRDKILVGRDGNPIVTAYHSNCGGITSSASMAWNRDLPYLVAIHDPFCDSSAHYKWTKTLPLQEWNAYLQRKGMPAGSVPLQGMTSPGRQKYLVPGESKLPMNMVREDLNLKSAFFTIGQSGGNILIKGRGYGHGVGMCQEGAMEMARVGYSYQDILMFYFHGVKLEQR